MLALDHPQVVTLYVHEELQANRLLLVGSPTTAQNLFIHTLQSVWSYPEEK